MISHSNINQALNLDPTHPACELYRTLYWVGVTPIYLGLTWYKVRDQFIARLNEMNFYLNSNPQERERTVIKIFEVPGLDYPPYIEKLLLRLISVRVIAKDIYPTSSQIISEILARLELNQLEFLTSSLKELKKDHSSVFSKLSKSLLKEIHDEFDQLFGLLAARIEYLKGSSANSSFELPFFELNNSTENEAIDSTNETAISSAENQLIDLTNEPAHSSTENQTSDSSSEAATSSAENPIIDLTNELTISSMENQVIASPNETMIFPSGIEFNLPVFSLTSSHTFESSFSLLNSQLYERKATNEWIETFWRLHRDNFFEAFKKLQADSLTMTIICADEKLAAESIEELILNLALNVDINIKKNMIMRMLNTILYLLSSNELAILKKSFLEKPHHLIEMFFQPAAGINLATQLNFLDELIVFVSGLKEKGKLSENPLAELKSQNPYVANAIAQAIDEANTPTTSAPRTKPRTGIKVTHPRQNPHSFHANQQRTSTRGGSSSTEIRRTQGPNRSLRD